MFLVKHMQEDLFEHFASNKHNGFLEDCTVTLIDKTNGADPTRREEYWRRVLKIVSPYGYFSLEVPYPCLAFIHFSEARVFLS